MVLWKTSGLVTGLHTATITAFQRTCAPVAAPILLPGSDAFSWALASSSRSQVQAGATSGLACVACDRPSVGVRWRHRCPWQLSLTLSLGRSRAGRERLLSPHAFRVCAAGSRVV